MSANAHTRSGSRHCPRHLGDVDLSAAGAQEHWYDAYPILHQEASVYRLPGEGLTQGADVFTLSRYGDINQVVKDPIRYTPIASIMLEQMAAAKTPPVNIHCINMMRVSMVTGPNSRATAGPPQGADRSPGRPGRRAA